MNGRHAVLFFLVGCAAAEGDDELVLPEAAPVWDASGPSGVAPPPQAPTMSQTALVQGDLTTFWVNGADPGFTVHFLYSMAGQGAGPCHPASGECLDILGPVTIIGSVVADGAGYAEVGVVVPNAAPLITVYTQALSTDGPTGAVSNTVVEDILPPPVGLTADIQPILDANCTAGCHSSPNPSAGLDLSGNAYNAIVGVPSDDVPAMDLIEPLDPANSYLWHKLNGTQIGVGGSGGRMPKGAPALSVADKDLIEHWILTGALP